MKATEFGLHPFNHAAAGWFLVRRLVNGDVPEVAYDFRFSASVGRFGGTSFELHFSGTVPLDVNFSTESDHDGAKRRFIKATLACMKLVSWRFADICRCESSMRFPSQETFNVALSILISAALKGIKDIGAYSPLARTLAPSDACLMTSPVWLATHTPEQLKDTARRINGYGGPFWDEVIAEVALSGAKQSDRKE